MKTAQFVSSVSVLVLLILIGCTETGSYEELLESVDGVFIEGVSINQFDSNYDQSNGSNLYTPTTFVENESNTSVVWQIDQLYSDNAQGPVFSPVGGSTSRLDSTAISITWFDTQTDRLVHDKQVYNVPYTVADARQSVFNVELEIIPDIFPGSGTHSHQLQSEVSECDIVTIDQIDFITHLPDTMAYWLTTFSGIEDGLSSLLTCRLSLDTENADCVSEFSFNGVDMIEFGVAFEAYELFVQDPYVPFNGKYRGVTADGLSIGSSRAEVEEVYGAGTGSYASYGIHFYYDGNDIVDSIRVFQPE